MKSKDCKILLGSVLYALIAGCTSQIDSTPNPVITDENPNAGGIYYGNITTDGSPAAIPVTAIFDSTQRFVIYANDQSALYAGLYSLVSSGISGQTRVFSLATGNTTGTASFNGTFESKSAINAAYNFKLSSNVGGGPDATGLINLPSYQTLIHLKPSATKLLEGTWDNHDNFGYSTISFTISGDGTTSGSSSASTCTYYNGKISTINLMYNVYKVEFTESCPSPGAANVIQTLVGLGSIFPANADLATPKQLVMAVSSATTARLFTLTPAIP
ncbi:MAG: hypothetical protein V4607_08715 [Pseudomonadota bacterium]